MNNTPNSKSRQSLFYRDLASPISVANRTASRFASSGQTSSFSPLRLPGSDALSESPPPPPAFTLDDRLELSPEPVQPVSSPDSTPTPVRNYYSTPETKETGMELGSPSSPVNGVVVNSNSNNNNKSGGGSGMSMGLITLPPPREAVRPELNSKKDNQIVLSGAVNEEEWVTVYGFSPRDTNLVLREFEKCGVILKHIPGPRDANWMHIFYQNRYDAQKALGKNGTQLNSVLIVGVKPIDPMQRQYLNDKLGGSSSSSSSSGVGFMVQPPPKLTPGQPASSRPQFYQNGGFMSNDRHHHHAVGSVASPAKSYVSRVMDMMFGF